MKNNIERSFFNISISSPFLKRHLFSHVCNVFQISNNISKSDFLRKKNIHALTNILISKNNNFVINQHFIFF